MPNHRFLAVLLFLVLIGARPVLAEDGASATSATSVTSATSATSADTVAPGAPILTEKELAQPWKLTAGQIKAWLKKDDQGRYLMTQLRKLENRMWTKQELVTIFGSPTDDTDSIPYYSWTPTDDNPGVVVVENSKVPGYETGKLYSLYADEATTMPGTKGKFLQLGYNELKGAK